MSNDAGNAVHIAADNLPYRLLRDSGKAKLRDVSKSFKSSVLASSVLLLRFVMEAMALF